MKKNTVIILAFCIVIITFAAYHPSIFNGFTNLDDPSYIINNAIIKELSAKSIFDILNFYDSNIYKTYSLARYHYVPLVLISFAFEYHFFNLSPIIYHSTNLLLHILNALLVLWMVLLLSKSHMISLIVAFLFALHPVQVEPVAWISARKDMLFSFFYLQSAILFIYYRKKRHSAYFIVSVMFYTLSILSKPMAISLPVLLIFFDNLMTKRIRFKDFKDKIPFFLVSLIYIAITFLVLKNSQSTNVDLAPDNRSYFSLCYISVLCYKLLYYPLNLILPLKNSCLNLLNFNKLNDLPYYINLSPLIIVLFSFIFFFISRISKAIIPSLMYYLISISPVVLIYLQLNIVADRFMYLPSLGIFYLFACFFIWLYDIVLKKTSFAGKIILSCLVIIIAAFTFMTFKACNVWKDSNSLWSHTIKNCSNNYLAYFFRGEYLKNTGKPNEAMEDYTRLLAIRPDYIAGYINRGGVYRLLGKGALACYDYNKAYDLFIESGSKYSDNRPILIVLFFCRGLIYKQTVRYDMAERDFSKALLFDPENKAIRDNRIECNMELKNYKKVLKDLTELSKRGYSIDRGFINEIEKLAVKETNK